ncbi:MAG: serine hydrolase domain-containing protein [Pseudomonadota bacterium]
MATLVSHKGRVLHEDYRGASEFGGATPIGPQSIFRIYSMTKPITSVAAVMLMEEGRLRLDEPVHAYIPEFRDTEVWDGGSLSSFNTRKPDRHITIKDLFLHTSGLTYGHLHQHDVDALYRKEHIGRPDETLSDICIRLAKLPLVFSPGAKWNYGVSTDVLARVIEIISGETLDVFLSKRIFDPLKMTDTGFYAPEESHDRLVACYQKDPHTGDISLSDAAGSESRAFARPPTLLMGGGGLVSTVHDYLRFCQCLLNGGTLDGEKLISRKSWEFMTYNHLPGGRTIKQMGDQTFSETRMDGNGFGLGGAVVTNVADTMSPGSVGTLSWGGMANTFFLIDPTEQLIAIQMTQMMPSTAYPVRPEFMSLVYAAL